MVPVKDTSTVKEVDQGSEGWGWWVGGNKFHLPGFTVGVTALQVHWVAVQMADVVVASSYTLIKRPWTGYGLAAINK